MPAPLQKSKKSAVSRSPRAADLLAWYDRHRRRMPWRALPGETADPYAVWLSEIMLQQTTVTAVKPYFEAFLKRWPTVAALARAPVEDVMTAWAGLGYYARARNLHKCAQAVAKEHGGQFPGTEEGLLSLPGIGPYTAAAVSAIAFDKHAVVVDGNVERVMARLFAVTDPLPHSKERLRTLAGELTPNARTGDYAQGVMDLGATVCTPKSPACVICPWSDVCEGRKRGIAETLPRKIKKAETPLRRGIAYWMVPGSDWTTGAIPECVPAKAKWRVLPGLVEHTFTHFRLMVEVRVADLTAVQAKKLGPDIIWTPLERIGDAGLPSVMAKVAKHAMKHV